MPSAAYALKENRDLDSVGAVVVDNVRMLNVRAALEANGGTYVTEDADEIAVLDAYDPIKRVNVQDAPPQADELDTLTKDQLLGLPEADQIDGAKSMKVDELRAAVRDAREEA